MFPDDNMLEYNQARLQLKETNCLFALSVSLIGSMLVQDSLCIFPLDLRIPGPEQVLICAYNLRWGLAFVCREEYLGEVERRLSLVKSEMEEEGVDAAVEVR